MAVAWASRFPTAMPTSWKAWRFSLPLRARRILATESMSTGASPAQRRLRSFRHEASRSCPSASSAVVTTKPHGWSLPEDGAHLAASKSLNSFSRSTGLGENALGLQRRPRNASIL